MFILDFYGKILDTYNSQAAAGNSQTCAMGRLWKPPKFHLCEASCDFLSQEQIC